MFPNRCFRSGRAITAFTILFLNGACWNLNNPDCTVDSASLSEADFRACYAATIIGKSQDSVFIQVPQWKSATDPAHFTNLVYAIHLDGTFDLIHEFDFLPGQIVTNGTHVAWTPEDNASVIVLDTSNGEQWTAWQAVSPQDWPYVQINRDALLVENADATGTSESLLLLDLENRSELRSETAASATLSSKWLALVQENGSAGDSASRFKVRLLATADGSEIEMDEPLDANWAPWLHIDDTTDSVFWEDYGLVDDFSVWQPPTRLVRWQAQTQTTSVIDPEFADGYYNYDLSIVFSNYTSRVLLDADNGAVTGQHTSLEPLFDVHTALFIEHNANDVAEVNINYDDYPAWFDGPRLLQNKMIWLDGGNLVLKVYDPQTAATSDIPIPH